MVHFVLEDNDIVYPVREPHEYGKLQHEEQLGEAEFSKCGHAEGRYADCRQNPSCNVVADGSKFARCHSVYEHRLMDKQWQAPDDEDEEDVG